MGRPRKVLDESEQNARRLARLETYKRYRQRNPDKKRAQANLAYKRNPEKIKARIARWKAQNKHIVSETNARRKAHVRTATPQWADIDAIRKVYLEATCRTVATGVAYHVDHIIPLRGKNVCGLHVAANLRAVPARINLQKGAQCPSLS